MSGALHIAAERRGERTVVDRLRQEGLSRSSRAFCEPHGAARLVLSQLGPGFVRGDRFELEVDIACDAELRLEAQAAGRATGRGGISRVRTRLTLARGAGLFYAGEPLILADGAAHEAAVSATLAPDAWLAWFDTIAPLGAFDSLANSFDARYGERKVIHDVMRLTPKLLPQALGSAYYLRSGMSAAETAGLIVAADALALELGPRLAVSIGIGSAWAGGVTVRARGPRVRAVRAALSALLTELRRIETSPTPRCGV